MNTVNEVISVTYVTCLNTVDIEVYNGTPVIKMLLIYSLRFTYLIPALLTSTCSRIYLFVLRLPKG